MARQMMSREEMLIQMRKKMEEMNSKGRKDPDEFRCPKAKDKETLEYHFKILPELNIGDACKTGICDIESPIWYYKNGGHFIDNDKLECPRLHDDVECPMCKMGFDLVNESDDEEYRKKIRNKYLAQNYYAVNIYFTNTSKNPDNVRGKVMWFNMPRTLWRKLEDCINSDDPGDEDDPKAHGVFCHPYEGCYTFKLVATKKGEFNTYEASSFLAKTFGPLIKKEDGTADEEAIEQILAQRHILQKKFRPRDINKLQSIVDKMMNKEQTGTDDDDGAEEIKNMRGAAATAKAPEAKPEPKVEQKQAQPTKTLFDEDVEEKPKESESEPAADEVFNDEEETPKPVAKPAVQKPAPAPAVTKPAVAKPAAAVKPAPAPAADGDDDDEELKALLNTIKSSKK